MRYALLFSLVAGLLAAAAVAERGWFFLLLWPSFSFAAVAMGYFWLGPRVFGKSPQGRLAPLNQIVLLPYIGLMCIFWYALRIVKREPAFNQLTDTIIIGRRLLSRELPDGINHVIDLTCEFSEPAALRSRSYHSFQILDGFVPPLEQLTCWAEEVAQLPGTVYIHCAEGHGRTGLFAAFLLLHTGHSQTPGEALQLIRSKRPLVRLKRGQLALLNAARESM